RRVEHQQQLDQVLLNRFDERLDDEHVALAAVGAELDLQAVVAESADSGRLQRRAEILADLIRQIGGGPPPEGDHFAHSMLLSPRDERGRNQDTRSPDSSPGANATWYAQRRTACT